MAQNVFKIDPAGTNSWNGTTISSLSSFSIDKQGDETVTGSDGKPFAQGAFVDNLSYVVTVNGYDSAINIGLSGTDGTLILKAVLRDNGAGVAATSATFTFSQAVVTGSNNTINHAGNSECSYTFRVVSADGVQDPMQIT